VAELRGAASEVKPEPRLLTDWSAYLPDDYVPDEHEKLALYRKLADTRDAATIDDVTLELMDRFGQLPPPAIALVELRRLRLLGAQGGVENLRVFQNVTEMILRRPLKPTEIRTVMGVLDRSVPIEFMTGREFGVRVRGEGILLLHRSRQALDALALAMASPADAGVTV